MRKSKSIGWISAYEKIWLVAVLLAIGIAIFNFVRFQRFDALVYVPLLVAGFSFMIYITNRNHKKFMQRFDQDQTDML